MLNTQNPVQSGTYCCTLPAAIYLTDYYVTCIQRQRIFFKTPCDPPGARTQDPVLKRDVHLPTELASLTRYSQFFLGDFTSNWFLLYITQHPCIMTGHIPNGNSCSIVYVVPTCPTFGHWCCILSKNYLFVLTSAKVIHFFVTTKCFKNFFLFPMWFYATTSSTTTRIWMRI